MGDTYAILGLRRKRAYLAGEIAQAERQLAEKYAAPRTLDATIQLFAPATNPELIPRHPTAPTRVVLPAGGANAAVPRRVAGDRATDVCPAGFRARHAGEGAADRQCVDHKLGAGAGSRGAGSAGGSGSGGADYLRPGCLVG